MCFPWLFFRNEKPLKKFTDFFPCSCELCGEIFDTMEKLIKHTGSHELWEINARLENQFGTVRCNKCWRSFTSVVVMAGHPCATVIEGLSPISSSGSLDSLVIHE